MHSMNRGLLRRDTWSVNLKGRVAGVLPSLKHETVTHGCSSIVDFL